jgi:hypothetical protein
MGVTYNYGAGPTYTKIASQTLGSAAASVTFSNLPQNYTDLVIIMQHKVSGSATAADGFIRVNSDTGSNYSNTSLNSDPGSSRQTGVSFWMWGADVSTEFTFTRFDLMNYSNNTTYKSILWRQGLSNVVFAQVGLWRSTAAITSLSFTSSDQLGQGTADNFASGSTFTLYGVAAALNTKATGGNITTDGTYFYHTFRSSGLFQPKQNITADYLVVAGGGGGGGRGGGGGGAGGMRCTVTGTGGSGSLESALSLTGGTTYTVTVGAGGAGGHNIHEPYTQGKIGSDSVFSTITSAGGGTGGGTNGENGGSGGSGGGGGAANGTGGSASPSGQGFSGGTASNNNRGGGGGGASAAGASGTSSGNGGAGRATSISGSSVTYAGGGGGGSWDAVSSGSGGSGGGGNGGAASTNGSNATAFTGGGGGAGGHNGTSGASNYGGAGGSGIVIVRYSA